MCGHLHQDILPVGVVGYAFCLAVANVTLLRGIWTMGLNLSWTFSLEGESCKRSEPAERSENLVPLDARKLLFQHAFSRYSAALKRSRNSNIHVKPHC